MNFRHLLHEDKARGSSGEAIGAWQEDVEDVGLFVLFFCFKKIRADAFFGFHFFQRTDEHH